MDIKKSYAKKSQYNKAKANRKTFKAKRNTYKSDYQNQVCCTFIDTISQLPTGDNGNAGALANTATVDDGHNFAISAVIALDQRNSLLNSYSHASLKNMFNEFNTSAISLDLLFSPELRKCADQVFMLVERGVSGIIQNQTQMCSDVNHRMYQLGNNTQKLTHVTTFNTAQDRINKKSASVGVVPADTNYLKILCTGKNITGAQLAAGDLQIKARVKSYNKYRDMKALSAGLN